MSLKTTRDFLRRVLLGWVAKLDAPEQTSARAQKEGWLQKEFHVPTSVVGVVSAFLVYGVLVFHTELTHVQAMILALFVAIVVILFAVYLHREQKELVQSDEAMALLAVIFFTTLIWIKLSLVLSYKYPMVSPYIAPVSIAPLLTTLMLNARLATTLSFAVAFIFGIIGNFSLPYAMTAAIGGATMVAAASRVRTAHQVARAGIIVGIVQACVVVFIGAMIGWSTRLIGVSALSAIGSGVLAAVFSLGVLPFMESFFSRISNLRLVELAALNHPLLQKLSMEAPGTYHHSLIVASLAEDAANAIGANGLLCRVGAYFHDIGKMAKAEYFIENQGTLGNPHDQVSPSLSKLVITSHVKEGMALARMHKLDQQILDFIPQHHGTSKIEYFYLKALKLEASEDDELKEEINEETYRYPGPRPKKKETAIVMLADSVEATSRTLEDPNHQRYKDMVNKIINKKLSDGQLVESPLTLKDLHIIAERFTNTLTSVHHARIPYPDAESVVKKEPIEQTDAET